MRGMREEHPEVTVARATQINYINYNRNMKQRVIAHLHPY